jgi:hypothetical protein
LQLVVEGDGEVRSAPVLVRRILHERMKVFDCHLLPAQRRRDLAHLRAANWTKFRNNYVPVALLSKAPVLWLLDCEDECARDAVREMVSAVAGTTLTEKLAVCMLVREYETLFLHDFATTRAFYGIEAELARSPEQVRGAKELISGLY